LRSGRLNLRHKITYCLAQLVSRSRIKETGNGGWSGVMSDQWRILGVYR